MKKEEIYLDMSLLTKGQKKEIIGMLPPPNTNSDYTILSNFVYLKYDTHEDCWWISVVCMGRSFITYEQFKELYPTWYPTEKALPTNRTPLEEESLKLITRMEQQLRLNNEDLKLNGNERLIEEAKKLINKLENKQ